MFTVKKMWLKDLTSTIKLSNKEAYLCECLINFIQIVEARFLMCIIVVICQFYIHIALDESFNFEWRNHHKFDNIAKNYLYT